MSSGPESATHLSVFKVETALIDLSGPGHVCAEEEIG